MVNPYQLAKDRLISKNKGNNSKLDHSDIRDLIIIAIVEGVLTSQKIAEFKQIERYYLWNMKDRACSLYKKFMVGSLGKEGHKTDKHGRKQVGLVEKSKSFGNQGKID